MKSYMAEVAKLLGTTCGDWFRIEGEGTDWFWLDDYGLHRSVTVRQGIEIVENKQRLDTDMLACLLTGEKTTIIDPWAPTFGNKVYYVDYDGEIRRMLIYQNIESVGLQAIGNCFETQDEAFRHKDEMLAAMRSAEQYAVEAAQTRAEKTKRVN